MSRVTGRVLAAVVVCGLVPFGIRAESAHQPEVFAPGVISGPAAEDSAAFTPDGKTVFFDRIRWPLYRSQYRDGTYQPPVEVKLGDQAAHQLDPAIAPDESFIVFDANYAHKDPPDRLYIAFREGDHWGAPVDLGDEVNKASPWGSHLGPDHRTLYFSSTRGVRVDYPRSEAQGRQDVARMEAWDNGLDNLWSISLAPWIAAHARGG